MVKAELTVQIYRALKQRGLTQAKAAELLGTTQAQVSALMRIRPVSVSVGRLMEFLTILGHDVEVRVKPGAAPARRSHVGCGRSCVIERMRVPTLRDWPDLVMILVLLIALVGSLGGISGNHRRKNGDTTCVKWGANT